MFVKDVIDQIPNHEIFHLCDVNGKIIFIGNWVTWSTTRSIWNETKDRGIHCVTAVLDSETGLPTISISISELTED